MSDQALDEAASAGDDVEVEWQFDAIDLRPVERWLAALPGAPFGADPAAPSLTALAKPAIRQVDRYLDTEDWRIGRAGLVLRTRRKGRREEATLKDSRPADANGLRRRLEVNESLPPEGVAALDTDGPVGGRLHAVAGNRPLHQVLEIRTRRRAFSLRIDGEDVAELALDETTIVGDSGARPAHLRRVEVEVVHRWVEALEPVVRDLRDACGLRAAALSKFEAGLLALGISIPGLPDLGSTAVTPESTMGDLAYAILRRHFGVLLARESGTRLGEDIEELHDMRVATRRLRAAIDLFVGVLPVRIGGIRKELGWLAAVLGEVRDLDVQLEHMDNMGEWSIAWATSEVIEDPLVHLHQLLVDQRLEARHQLLEALDSVRYQRLVKGLTSLVIQGPARRSAAAGVPAATAVTDLVAQRHRSVLKGAKRAKKSGVAADYHRLRIRAKRLRYSLEFTSGLYDGSTDRFVRRMARLQDALGLMQDAEVATEQLLGITREHGSELPPLTIFAMGSVAERYRDEAADLLASMSRRLKVLDGSEWIALEDLMAARHQEALTNLPPPRPRTRPTPRPATTPAPDLAVAGPDETQVAPDGVAVVALAALPDEVDPFGADGDAESEDEADRTVEGGVALVAYGPPPAAPTEPEADPRFRQAPGHVGEG
ncbi:MAG TPA: CHAD domain-containing protein [Acidimicrobiales bacterium]|jgi:CHAD domain-containing protein|nr:CHAD domain-containing protein [Acidimicrobiales bacterium]